ncbi:MAG TPA: ABC transporter ATP-binding protein [Chloroflexota bacterium]|nr:ABC transporter ATP-binding protein [Chloroflexota bacterium]
MLRQFRLLRYVRPHGRQVGILTLTMALTVAVDVLKPWPTKLLVDQVLNHRALPPPLKPLVAALPGSHGSQGLLLWVALATVLLFAAGTAVAMVGTFVSVGFGQRITFDLASDLFLHVQRLSLLFHTRRQVGDTISRVTGDPYCVQTLVVEALLPLIQSVIMLVAMFVIMWSLNETLTLLSLAVVPFLAVTIRVYGGPMKDRTRKRRDLEGRIMAVVEQTLTAIPAVQAFTREDLEHGRFRRLADATVHAYVRSAWIDQWFKVFAGLITAVGAAAIMYLGGTFVLQGKMTVGTILVFIAYLESLYMPLNDIIYTASTMQATAAEADRVLEIIDTPLDVKDAPDATDIRITGYVEFRDVTFGYEEGRPVLHDVSLAAKPGDVVAIVGPTGAGKSTLVSLLVRFFDPWSGAVLVDGRDIRSVRLRSLREQIGLVLQDPFILPLTVAENIAYGDPHASKQAIVEASIAANADEFIRRLPQGYDTVIGERGTTLSGGERQRLSIARAFLKNAPILVLDEPTSALDARTESLLLEALARLMRDRTTFVVAHRLSTIRNATTILVIDRGRVVEQGTHHQLMERDGLYAGLYVQQMEIARHEPVPDEDASGARL